MGDHKSLRRPHGTSGHAEALRRQVATFGRTAPPRGPPEGHRAGNAETGERRIGAARPRLIQSVTHRARPDRLPSGCLARLTKPATTPPVAPSRPGGERAP